VLIVVLCVVVPYIDLSRTEMGAEEEKKIQKEKLALTSLSTKIYLKRAGREHTHTHTHTRKEEEEEFKKLKKKL